MTLLSKSIAGVLSVKPASLYNHTSSVAEITSAVGHAALSKLNEYLDDASGNLTGANRLAAMAVAYRTFAKENEELYKVIINLSAFEDDSLLEDSHVVVQRLYDGLKEYGLPAKKRIMAARALRSGIHGFIALIFRYRDFLFTGDLFHTDKGHLTPTKRLMNWDNAMLAATIGRLLDMQADMLCPAHGNPVPFSKSVREELIEVKAYYGRR